MAAGASFPWRGGLWAARGRRGSCGSFSGERGLPSFTLCSAPPSKSTLLERLNGTRAGGVAVVAGRRCGDGSDVAGKTRPGLVSSSLPRGALCLLSRARRAIGRAEASQDTALFTRKRAKALRGVRARYLDTRVTKAPATLQPQRTHRSRGTTSSHGQAAPKKRSSRRLPEH